MSARPSEIVRNNVKEKLARGEVVSSITVRLVRSIEIVRIAKTAGFDSIYVDVEHSSLSLETTSQICIAALEIGMAPFVRVPSTRPEHVSRALDGGALGVIAPHIRSAAERMCGAITPSAPPSSARETCSGRVLGTRTKGAIPISRAAMQIWLVVSSERLECSTST